MAERNSPSTTRLFYTVAVWVTFIHCARGIHWTQEKVNQLRGSVHILLSSHFARQS